MCPPCAGRDGIQVKAVRGVAGGGICRWSLPCLLHEPLGALPVPAGGVGDRHVDLRQFLPQVAPQLARPFQRLQDLVGRRRDSRPSPVRSRRESGGREGFVQGAFVRGRGSAGLDDVARTGHRWRIPTGVARPLENASHHTGGRSCDARSSADPVNTSASSRRKDAGG